MQAGRQLVWVGNQRVDVPKLRTPPISAEKAKLGGSYAGGSFEIQPEAEEIAVRIRGPIEQEVRILCSPALASPLGRVGYQ